MSEEYQLSETDRELMKLVPWACKFQDRLRLAIERKEDGMHRLTFHVKSGEVLKAEAFCGETGELDT